MKQFPTLMVSGGLVCIYDSSGTLIHGVEYSSDWYKDDLKSHGGWSLEMIDSQFPFYDDNNWIASNRKEAAHPVQSILLQEVILIFHFMEFRMFFPMIV